jgi:hypothetical protein
MDENNNLDIMKKIVDEMTTLEKRLLIKYIKDTMQPPAPPIQINNLVTFK